MTGRQPYQVIISPHWKRVSIYDGGETFLREFVRTPEVQRNLLAAHWCQSEVMNGGFWQFFFNSTGVLAPEAARAFEAIGLPRLGALVRGAMALFGDEYPRDRAARRRRLEEPIFLREMDEEFFRMWKIENGGWLAAANAYAATYGAAPR